MINSLSLTGLFITLFQFKEQRPFNRFVKQISSFAFTDKQKSLISILQLIKAFNIIVIIQ